MNLWTSLRGLPKAVWMLSGAFLVNRAGSMILPFLVLYGTRERGFSAERAGLVVTFFGLGTMLAAPLAGRLADRFSPLAIMQTSLVAGGVAAIALPAAKSFSALAAGIFIWAVLSESYRAPSLAIIGDITSPGQRKPAFALVRLAVNLGLSIGPVVGGLLAERSFTALFIGDGATSLLAGILLIALAKRMGLPSRVSAAAAAGVPPVRAALRDGKYLYFLAAMLPVLCVFFQSFGGMALYVVRDLGISTAAYGLLLAINTVLIVFLDVPVNAATVAWPHSRALFLGCALVAVGFGALAFARTVPDVAATVVLWTFGEIYMFASLNALAVELAPDSRRGEYMGLFQMTFSASFLVGPALGVFVLEKSGSGALWGGCFAVALISGVLLARVPPRLAEPAREPTAP
jgi:MFS family permease